MGDIGESRRTAQEERAPCQVNYKFGAEVRGICSEKEVELHGARTTG